ncbi:MAG: exosortase-associated EpsI family protein [Planctomycetota bacterium]
MPPRDSNRSAIRTAAPLLSAVVLAVLIAANRLNPKPPAGIELYVQEVVATIDAVPYRIAGWTGSDLDGPPAEVQELLQPSTILHRRYRQVGGENPLRLVIVHCEDVRDMQGHHPPNCYPATGWSQVGAEPIDVSAFGGVQRMEVHRFSRYDDAGVPRDVTIASAFLVPGASGRLVPDMRGLYEVAENQRRSRLGAAQVQIILDERAPLGRIQEAVEAFLPAIQPVAERVTEGTS